MITKLNPDAIKNNSITIDKLADVHSVTWDENSNINNFIKQGRYFISGERKNDEDGLPTDSNNFNAELLVLEQDISIDYSKQYFTIQALETGNISFGIPLSTSLLKYRKNNGQWIETTDAVQIPVNSNDKIQISCICNAFRSSSSCSSIFNIDTPYIVYGNIMSLLYGDDFKDKTDLTEKDSTFGYLFNSHKTLKNAENLILPATTLSSSCYSHMFYGCTSLVTAPELPATTLAEFCYYWMFQRCTSLNKVTMLATDITYYHALTEWLNYVAPKGTFVKHPDMTSLPIDSDSGVPSGWELMDYVSENNENKNNYHVITQKLTISTSEGNSDTYTRTGIGSTSNDIKWKNWGKLQQFIDLGKGLEFSKLDNIIDNGIYTGNFGDWGLMGPFTLLVLNDQEFIQENTTELEGVFKHSIVQILFNANTFATANDIHPITLLKRYGVGDDNIKWEEWASIDENFIKINYLDLRNIKNNYGLMPGMKYHITDYKASSIQENTITNENSYPVIIVEAVDRNILNENALYLKNSCISEIKYCLDNDTDRFSWADTDNGKGVIYYMKDEYGNEAPYDFKNIMYLKDDKEVPTFGENCSNNIIKEYKKNNIFKLPEITFGNNCTNNSFESNCYGNTFGNSCTGNTFGRSCHTNTFGYNCTDNTFGDYCDTNSFGDSCYGNTFGNNCDRNTFESGCTYNTFGEQCVDNTFGKMCISNTVGNYCDKNTFKINCANNTFGKYCNNNTFGDSCTGNTFGNNCKNNTTIYKNYNNTIGNECNYITFTYDSSNNRIGNNCWYIYLNGSNYNTFDDYCGILDSILIMYADPGNYLTATDERVTIKLINSNYNYFDKNSKNLILTKSNSNTIKNNTLIDDLDLVTERTNKIVLDYTGQGIYDVQTALSKANNEYENVYKPNKYLQLDRASFCLICESKGEISMKQNRIIGYTLE